MAAIDTLQPVVVLLGAGIASVMILPRIGISPIIGFLMAGVVFGEHGLDLIPHNETIHLLAELGVVFLLFDIGLHFSMREIWYERKAIFILGPLQVFITAGVFFLIGMQLGLAPGVNIVLSIALSLSSTAVVSQVIADKGMAGCPNASKAMAILIFQDVCAIFLLILAGSLAGGGSLGTAIGLALLKCIASFLAAMLIGKYILKPFFRTVMIAKNSEVFTMIALFLVLITGMATGAIGLSLTLGAFLAGMIISETALKHVIQTELRPFRFLLIGFFFVTVGMILDFRVVMEHWKLVLAISLTTLAVKSIILFGLFLLMKEKLDTSAQQAGLLFQGSEFLLVVIAYPAVINSLESSLASALIASVAISMAATSFVFSFAYGPLSKLLAKKKVEKVAELIVSEPSPTEVVILGMNEIGFTVARAMNYFDIPYLCIAGEYEAYEEAARQGFPVIFGEQADMRFWESIGIQNFRHLAISRPSMELAEMYKPIIKSRHPNLKRYTVVEDQKQAQAYEQLDIFPVFSRGVPPGLELSEIILKAKGVEQAALATWVKKAQQDYYESRQYSAVS